MIAYLLIFALGVWCGAWLECGGEPLPRSGG